MDVFLDPNSKLKVSQDTQIDTESYEKLLKLSSDFAYDTFISLKNKHMEQVQETYDKYSYALKLRLEAAEQIGIENIKKARIKKLQAEKDGIESDYRAGKQVYPEFQLMAMFRLEA